jgi:hypothetical protein
MGIFPTSIVNLELPLGVDLTAAPDSSSSAASAKAAAAESALLQEVAAVLKAAPDAHALALLSVAAARAALSAASAGDPPGEERLASVVWLEEKLGAQHLSPLAAASIASKAAGKLFARVRETAGGGRDLAAPGKQQPVDTRGASTPKRPGGFARGER